MKIYSCKTNHITDPIGYAMEKPTFSWKVAECAGSAQASARVLIARDAGMTDIVYDSGELTAADSIAFDAGFTPEAYTRYFWTVEVKADNGESTVSAPSFFETAKQGDSWHAGWIGCDDNDIHPVFSKTVDARSDAVSARLYICGLGLYRTFFDGSRIDDEYLTPYLNGYNNWLQYQTYDVTEQVRKGGLMEIYLGNGWYKGRYAAGWSSNPDDYYGTKYKLIAEVRIVRADGSVEYIGTDTSWAVRRSRITFDDIYDGEKRDDTLDLSPAYTAVETEAPKVPLKERYSLPVKANKVIKAEALLTTPKGEKVFDLGQNFAGVFRLRVRAPKGRRVYIQVGELLQDDCFYRDNLRSALAEYEYISDGVEKVIEPVFTFYGYRFAKVEGLDDLTVDDFEGVALYSSLDDIGSIKTGNKLIDRLVLNSLWGLRSNFVDVPTDCPQRDERFGWTGDAEAFAPTALLFTDAYAFYRKYLHDMYLEQIRYDGMVPDVVPAVFIRSCACAWGDAATIIPTAVYESTGDLTILREQYDSMKAWVDYLLRLDGDDHGWRNHGHYGDWLALDGYEGGDSAQGGTDKTFCADVYLLYSIRLLIRAAELLGKTEDAAEYRKTEKKQFDEITQEYYTVRGRCRIDTQTAHVLTLAHGLGPCPENSLEYLLNAIHRKNDYIQTGFIGTGYLLEALSARGESALAYKLLLNKDYPGWLYEVLHGATTIWERWNSVLEDGSCSSTGMNSMNHYAYGSVSRWIFERAGGLRQAPGSVGYSRIEFAPEFNTELGSLEAEYDSASGKWLSSWKYVDDSTVEVSLTVPFGCCAEVKLGDIRESVGAGEYKYTVKV